MTILSKIDQKGRSMVEMLGVLAIIGVLSVGGISGYSKAMAKFKLTKAQDQMSMILMNIRTAFATSSSYIGLNNGTAISFGIAPNEMFNVNPASVTSTARINNAFGGETYIYACGTPNTTSCFGHDTTADGINQYFAITMAGLGREACISLASSDWGTDGLVSVTIHKDSSGTLEASSAANSFTTDELPITPMGAGRNAGNLCNDFGKYSAITWTYY